MNIDSKSNIKFSRNLQFVGIDHPCVYSRLHTPPANNIPVTLEITDDRDDQISVKGELWVSLDFIGDDVLDSVAVRQRIYMSVQNFFGASKFLGRVKIRYADQHQSSSQPDDADDEFWDHRSTYESIALLAAQLAKVDPKDFLKTEDSKILNKALGELCFHAALS
jgi:hypothetical protein